jgi:hypothetical protein
MIEPEAAEAILRAVMEKQIAITGMLLVDIQQQMILSALLPPSIDAAQLAGQIYRAYQSQQAVYDMLESRTEYGLLWGDKHAVVFRASLNTPLLLTIITHLPVQLALLLIDMKNIIDELERL